MNKKDTKIVESRLKVEIQKLRCAYGFSYAELMRMVTRIILSDKHSKMALAIRQVRQIKAVKSKAEREKLFRKYGWTVEKVKKKVVKP